MELSNALPHVKLRHGLIMSFKLCIQITILAMVYSMNVRMAVQAAKTPAIDLTPAPAPAPMPPPFENVTQSLVFGGNYETFISLLVETKMDVVFQGMANNTEGPGVTIFAPTDKAFSSKLVTSLLKNLTVTQTETLVQYHALPYYQAFRNLQNSHDNQTSTLASNSNKGGSYQVNITFTGGGRLQISSGWTVAILSTTVYSKRPISIFAIDHVLLPDELFGLPPPPPPPSPPPPVRSPPAPAASSSSHLKSSPPSNGSSSPFFIPSISYLFMSLLLYKILGILQSV